MTGLWSAPTRWPRAFGFEIRPRWPMGWEFGLAFFRNPDAGVRLAVSLIHGRVLSHRSWVSYTELFRLGPGQCGEQTWNRDDDLWCYRPFGHEEPHAYSMDEALS